MKIRYYLYRIKWHFAYYFNFKNPIHIDLELNNNCNQSCLSCWHNKKTLPFELHSFPNYGILELDKIKKSKAKSIKLNWRGEPLLYKSLFWVISIFRYNFIEIMMNTNGVLLKDRLELLNNSGITKVIISVDSFDQNNYMKIHNCDLKDFNDLINSLGKLCKYRYNFETVLNFHKNKINENELNLLEKMLSRFKIIKRYTENREGENISIQRTKIKRKRNCPHMMRRLTIAANGKIFPCCIAYKEPDDLLLGNIKDGNIYDVWNSNKRKEMIKNYKKGIYLESCKNCTSGDIWKK